MQLQIEEDISILRTADETLCLAQERDSIFSGTCHYSSKLCTMVPILEIKKDTLGINELFGIQVPFKNLGPCNFLLQKTQDNLVQKDIFFFTVRKGLNSISINRKVEKILTLALSNTCYKAVSNFFIFFQIVITQY